jgi:Rrf2 family protein
LRSRGVLYSVRCSYAIRAAVFLARERATVVSTTIARECKLPRAFLSPTLRSLVSHGILSSTKGAKGGFALRRDPAEIRLLDVVEAIDEERWSTCCPMGYPQCSPMQRCAMHDSWQEIRGCIEQYLRQTTLAELANVSSRTA